MGDKPGPVLSPERCRRSLWTARGTVSQMIGHDRSSPQRVPVGLTDPDRGGKPVALRERVALPESAPETTATRACGLSG